MIFLKAVFIGVVCAFIVMFLLAAVFNADGGWIVVVGLILGALCGYGDFVQGREKQASRMVRRIEAEELIRERVRREMDGRG